MPSTRAPVLAAGGGSEVQRLASIFHVGSDVVEFCSPWMGKWLGSRDFRRCFSPVLLVLGR